MPRACVVVLLLCIGSPLAGCATVSVYEPVQAEINLTDDQSILRNAAEKYCRDAQSKGLAAGEAGLRALAGILGNKGSAAAAYWKRIGADTSAPAGVITRVRADLNQSARGLADLDTMARALLGSSRPSRLDVSEFEKALIHARQARASFSEALAQLNRRSENVYQIAAELSLLDAALEKARTTADELAAARTDEAGLSL